MSSSCLSMEENEKHEVEFSEFLIKRIENAAGGLLQLHHISGHLSQLSFDVRCAIGTSKEDIKNFLLKHKNLFRVDGNVVKLVNYSHSKESKYDSDNSSKGSDSTLPLKIEDGKGVIVKIFPLFGFIKTKEPVKTEVYFRASIFGGTDVNLTSFLYVGTMVYFNAKKKSNEDSRSKYIATKVWKVDGTDMQNSALVQKSRKSRETGLYDPLTLDSEGIIQTIFPNLGFIAVKGDENNTVFFHKNRLVNYDNVVDLTKVLSKGDIVEFNAHRSTKQNVKARWEATKVWKKSMVIKKKNEIPNSNSSSSIQSSLCSHPEMIIKNENKAKEMIKNQHGKICPRSHGSVIKFGENGLADGYSSMYYICGHQVTDISWEFSEGDNVIFDAVKIKSAPGWKAVLVWVGEKPDVILPTCLGDFSEFTDEEENEDALSNYMSESSNASLKSISVKSESNSSKSRELQKENTSTLFKSLVNRDVKEYNKRKDKMHNSSSQYSSLSSLSSSQASTNSQRSDKRHKNKNSLLNKNFSLGSEATLSWGDSPYAADENYQNISESNCSVSVKNIQNERCIKAEISDEISEHSSSSVEEKADEKMKSSKFSYSPEVTNEEELTSESSNNLKVRASIKSFQCIEGKIIKLYSKFAQVKSYNLQNTVSFFWNNFYSNGLSVEQLELDDLKQVLEVGDVIHFNYFEIVDDSGQNWQKVSLAWSGPKPIKAIEMSPEDFIKQNNLSVSNIESVIVNGKKDKVVPRKFLTAFDDEAAHKVDEVSRTESCSEDESLSLTEHSEDSKEYDETVNKYKVLDAVRGILKKKFSPYSKVDLNSLSEEIINVVLENHTVKKYHESCEALLQNESCEKNSDGSCASCGQNYTRHTCVEKTSNNSEAQTIVTGEIIAQNIFTEC